MITKGLGVLAQVVQERTSAKGAEGEQSGDFLGGLMNMVKEFGNANKQESQGTSQLSQEDIARITAGLGTLATTLKEKAFGGGAVDEEAVTKLDAQGGKVQVSSVVEKPSAASTEQPPAAGGDFLSGLMNVAKDVGKALGEQNQTRPAANTSGNTAQQGGSQLSPEDIARITAGLGSLVDTIKTKAFKKDEEQEEKATKVDSQDTKVDSQISHGPKPMSLLDRADAQAEQTLKEDTPGHHFCYISSEDFLSGLLSVAKDVGKAVEKNQSGSAANASDFLSGLLSVAKDVGKAVEKNQSGSAANASGSAGSGSQGGAQLSQEDIAKLTAGLGSLVGAIQGKATDYFQKKPAEEENKPKDEPVIDDVEEQIGKVVLPGYTGYKDSSTVSKPKTT
ncbi:unnamed protein product [Haemonchus placei]|uniref:Uncharacterized protein n=2 Tax=Haemonchus placei TaxID=6290 RepID=A0A3P7ZCR1_HAEPC|nr:unnamed protein product [Haemonchus placei]